MKKRIIGIRPGEKLHEVLCLPDVAHQTIEFDRHYVVKPSFKFRNIDVDYVTSADGHTGVPVSEDLATIR